MKTVLRYFCQLPIYSNCHQYFLSCSVLFWWLGTPSTSASLFARFSLISPKHSTVLTTTRTTCWSPSWWLVYLTLLRGGWPSFCKSDHSAWRLAIVRFVAAVSWHATGIIPRLIDVYNLDRRATTGCLTHKYLDDTTMTEFMRRSAVSSMQLFVNVLVQEATDVEMTVNCRKTKELLIGSVIKDPPPPVNLSGTPVERVTTFELMGVHLASDLKLTQHRRHHVEGGIATTLPQVAETIRRRAWWHAVLLRHGDSDITRVRLSCMTRSLTTAQTKALQSLQRTATRVIFQDSNYTMSLIKAELETLESRRDQLTERFFERSVLSETSCLHYLLPDKLRHSRNFETLKSRTVTFRNSFIPFSVIHYV